jgi:hypothetical protein
MRVLNICVPSLFLVGLVFLFGCSKPNQVTEQAQTVGNYQVILKPKASLKAGENRLDLSVQALDGSLPEDLKVSVKTIMPEMPKMAVPESTITKEENGQYAVKTDFVMGGDWDITVSLVDATSAPETAEFHVKVAD